MVYCYSNLSPEESEIMNVNLKVSLFCWYHPPEQEKCVY